MGAYENVTGFTEFYEAANTHSGGLLALTLPVVLWVALFGFALVNGRSKAIVFASFVTGILLLIENLLGLVDYWVIVADMILLTLGIFMLMLEGRRFGV